MVARRTSTVTFALVVFLVAVAAPAGESSKLSAETHPPLVDPQLLALAEDLGGPRPQPVPNRFGRPPDRFERGPRMCMVVERCPSEPCVQFVERDRREGPACDRFPDPGDARMLPLSRP